LFKSLRNFILKLYVNRLTKRRQKRN